MTFANCALPKGPLGAAQNPKNLKNFACFCPREASARSLRAPHAGFAGMWGTTTLRARFARGYSYLIVCNLLSPLNFSPPSSVPPPLSLFSAPTPLPLLGPWTFCGLSLGTRWRFVYPGADQCAWFSMSGAPEVSRHSVDILWTFHGPSADLLRACLPPTHPPHPHPSSPHPPPPPPTQLIF